jgi:hypothetical protein
MMKRIRLPPGKSKKKRVNVLFWKGNDYESEI